MSIRAGLKLQLDLASAEPPPTLIDRLNFFRENLVKAIRSGDRHGSPHCSDGYQIIGRFEILDCTFTRCAR
jgi:hypothetical protein